jgi:hypothetical protein
MRLRRAVHKPEAVTPLFSLLSLLSLLGLCFPLYLLQYIFFSSRNFLF